MPQITYTLEENNDSKDDYVTYFNELHLHV